MEFELVLRKVGTGAGFLIPKIFLSEEYARSFVEPRLILGYKYKVIIEEVK